MSKKIIGIDLGTTNSCVAVMEGAEVKIIENEDGKRTTPSVVAEKEINGKVEVIVGQAAVRGAALNSKNTYTHVKRFMGRKMSEVGIKEKESISYSLGEGSGGEVRIQGRRKALSPEEISAHILRKIKTFTESKLGTTIEKAIITVPAYFNNEQREATKNAGVIAGLEVLRVINEPTAAALAYGFEKKKNGKVLVYDLGGGTFDVSVLSIDDGVIEVISTKGDMILGGEDFDNAIVDAVSKDFYDQYSVDLKKNPSSLSRLKEAAEEAKKTLSTGEQVDINIPFIHQDASGPLSVSYTLTRTKFNNLVQSYVDRTIKIVDEALRDAKLTVGDINEVLLVGGQTRSPIITEAVKKHMNKEPNKSLNPDEVVAYGAAVQGAILSGDNSEVKDLLLLDVTPLSLGLETLGGVMTILIPRNTTIPAQKSQIFSTAEDNQTSVTVAVYQGERSMARDNKSLGQFELHGIAPAKRGIPQIEISFSLNANGILEVSAKDKNTGKEHKITITNSGGLTKEEIEKMKAEAEQHSEADQKKKLLIEVTNQLEQSVYSGEKNLEEFKEKISQELKDEISGHVAKGKEILKEKKEEINEMEEQIRLIQNSISKIGEEMSKQPASQGDQPEQKEQPKEDSNSKEENQS